MSLPGPVGGVEHCVGAMVGEIDTSVKATTGKLNLEGIKIVTRLRGEADEHGCDWQRRTAHERRCMRGWCPLLANGNRKQVLITCRVLFR